MKILYERRLEHIEQYALEFDDPNLPGAGWSFDCDKDGNLLDPTRENYVKIMAGEIPVTNRRIVDLSRDFMHEEVRLCDCGGYAYFARYCGAFVCSNCGQHDGLARCYCGWSQSGRNGRQELIEMGETIGD